MRRLSHSNNTYLKIQIHQFIEMKSATTRTPQVINLILQPDETFLAFTTPFTHSPKSQMNSLKRNESHPEELIILLSLSTRL
mmetsp:Transcript_27217/g.36155  ORF Transcript_27217/g.36155 Transcript_27217/m.36155 type:complete len:82 (-) Transcript_27217:3013-3258(-)